MLVMFFNIEDKFRFHYNLPLDMLNFQTKQSQQPKLFLIISHRRLEQGKKLKRKRTIIFAIWMKHWQRQRQSITNISANNGVVFFFITQWNNKNLSIESDGCTNSSMWVAITWNSRRFIGQLQNNFPQMIYLAKCFITTVYSICRDSSRSLFIACITKISAATTKPRWNNIH